MNNIELTNSKLLDDSILNERSSNCCGNDGFSGIIEGGKLPPMRKGRLFPLSEISVRDKAIQKGLIKESKSNFTNESLLDGLTENTSLLNADGECEFSNAISSEQVDAAAKAATAAAMIIQQQRAANADSDKSAIKSSCGRKPLIGKNKKEKYQKCVNDFLKKKQDAEKANTQAPSSFVPAADYTNKMAAPQEDDKILGVPKGLAIGLGIAVLALGGFVAFKMIKRARG